jgi:hypothetical protein
VQSEIQHAVTLISSLSLLFFLGFFICGFFSDAFRAWRNPYVRNAGEMEFFFNPMYFSWLFATDRRKWSLYTTIYSALLAFVVGILFSLVLLLSPSKPISYAFELGSIVSMCLLVIEPLCWYMGICKPLAQETQSEYVKEDASEREQAFSHD